MKEYRIRGLNDLKLENIPQELKQRRQWVAWESVPNPNGRKPRKIPIDPHTGREAKSNDSATWGSYDESVAYIKAHPEINGLMFCISNTDPYTGIDIDGCLDGETGAFNNPMAEAVVRRCGTYGEISPSGRGLKLLLKGAIPLPRKKFNLTDTEGKSVLEVEIYNEKRFWTITGHVLDGCPKEIAERQDELAEFYKFCVGKPKQPSNEPHRTGDTESTKVHRAQPQEVDKLRAALTYLDYDDENVWFTVCCCLKNYSKTVGDETARALWDEWSKRSNKYDETTQDERWDRVQAEGQYASLTVATIFQRALEAGYEAEPAPAFMSAADLSRKTFEPIRWIVPTIIPEGLTILGGKPKIGKSWLVLDIGIQVARGGMLLGQPITESGKVLYLALEDGERRLKDRIAKLLDRQPSPSNLLLADAGVGWQKLDRGGLDQLEASLRCHPDTKLVIIDTLQRIKPSGKRHQNAYENDYNAIGGLHAFAIKHHIGIILVHHLRKSDSTTGDVFDEVSGSLGLTGVADTNIVIKRSRGCSEGTLHLTSRDAGEQDLMVAFDENSGKWSLLGKAQEWSLTETRKQIEDILKGVSGNLDAKEIQAALEERGIKKNPNTIRWNLRQMVEDGQIESPSKGQYRAYAASSPDRYEYQQTNNLSTPMFVCWSDGMGSAAYAPPLSAGTCAVDPTSPTNKQNIETYDSSSESTDDLGTGVCDSWPMPGT